MLKVMNVVGARPNFMKVAPIVAAMKRAGTKFQPLVVDTRNALNGELRRDSKARIIRL